MLPDMKQEKVASFRQPTPDEQQILIHLNTRPVRSDEVQRFNQLMAEHHYLRDGQLVGEHLRYVAEYGDQWLALAAWSAPALHIKARDRFIGWNEEQRRTRLPLLVNNSRLLVLPPCRCPNLISRFMKLMLARLPAGNASTRISTESMSGPSKSGCASWFPRRAANTARGHCRRSGRSSNKKPRRVARPKPHRCAAWSNTSGRRCRSSAARKRWPIRWLAFWP